MADQDFVAAVLAAGCSSTQQLQSATQASTSLASVRRLVLDHGTECVARDLQQHIQSTAPIACKAVQAVLSALRAPAFSHTATAADTAACAQLRSTLFSQVPSWVHSIPADEQQFAADLVTAVMPDVDQLCAEDLAGLVTAVLAGMEQKQPHACTLLELLPVCLAALQVAPGPATSTQAAAAANAADAAAEEEAVAAAAGGAVEAAKHRDAAVHRLCHCQWQPGQVCQILPVLKGLVLTPEQMKTLLAKAIRACRNAGLQQLPPILYQVLLLSGSTPGMRCYALRLITSLFDLLESNQGNNGAAAGTGNDQADEDAQQEQQPQAEQQQGAMKLPSATLMQVQATLLMHVSTMLRYDAALGNEWVKWVSGEGGATSTNYFLLQVLLTMSRQPKHEQTVLQLLKKRVVQACEEQAAGGSSGSGSGSGSSTAGGCNGWMSGLQQVNRCPSIGDLQHGLLKAIRCSSYASELVAPGLLQLADMLISIKCSSPLHVVLAMKGQCGIASLPPQAPASARAVVLGLQLLQEVFAIHAEARGEVLKVVQGRLASNDLSAALPIVLLLGSITQQQPALLSDYLPQLKECMASFAGLSSDTAMSLLLAVWPLCRVRSDLQDFVVMLLRKMMYRQDVDGRKIALSGFLRLICQHLQDSPVPQPVLDPSAASCSQASLSQRASLSSSKGVNLLQELTGVMRRALSQQAPVREALYEGILQILAADPASAELLAELLLPHMRSYMVEDDQQLPPLLLHKCAQLAQGNAVLVEPLAALLSCVYRLTSTAQLPQAAVPPTGPGSLEASENWVGPGAEEQQEQTTTDTLKACFDSIRVRLGQCQLDHFELPCAADMSPMQPDGLLGQLHAANLLGALQVVIEAAVADVTSMVERQPDANLRDGDAVNKLGAELMQLFMLHSELYQLAMEGGKAGSKKGRKPGGSAAAADGSSQPTTAPTVGQKRPRPSDSFTPVNKQRPRFSAPCLAQLCMAIVDDGLMQLPSSYDVSNPDHHAQLAREMGFRACVLRSCTSLLEDAQAAAASAMLLHNSADEDEGSTAPAAAEVLELGPALYKVARLVMQTATAGGRPSVKPTSSSSGGGEGRKAASAAGAAGEGSETLEHLSATALLQLIKLADATQQLAPLFAKLPLGDGSTREAALGSSSGSAASDAAAEVAAAVMPVLPQLLSCTDSLLQQGCFKEAQVMVECLALLGRRLEAPTPAATSGPQQQPGQQQKDEPAYAALSRWAHQALQQQDPEVKAVPLVRGLLEVYIRCHGKDCVVAVKTAMQAINEVVGDTEGSTQSTQEHGTILPMLVGGKTAQPAALTPLGIINEGLEQLEKLTAANLKGGVFQDGDGASVAKSRRKLAAVVCKRLHDLLACLKVLVGTVIAMPVVIDQQTRVATRAYKLLATLAKAYQIPKKSAGQAAADVSWTLSTEFESLVGYVHKDLTPALNHALKDLGTENDAASLARVKKDAKLLPALVYAMEEWERKLVSTGKSANKNLLRDAKRSFCRDFKVKVAAAPAGQQQAAAAVTGGPPRAQGQRGKPRGPKAGPSQQQPAGSRGSGASGGRAGSSGRRGGSSAGAEEEGQEEEVDGVMGQEEEEVEGEGDEGDVEMGEAGDEEEGEEAYEEENGQQQQQQQKHVGRVAGGQGAGRAPLQRRQA